MGNDPPADIDELKRAVRAMIADLRDGGAVPGVGVGEKAPDFVLSDALGASVSLQERLSAGPVVVSFYRGAWCPICSTELRALQGALGAIEQRGASLIAVSPQAPDDSLSLVERLALGFDVLSDVDQAVARAYRIHFEVSDAVRAIYPQIGMDLSQHNADGTWYLPVPATFIVGPDGVVRDRHVDPNYLERMPVADVLSALDGLGPLPS